jgi:putative membrane protein
MMGWGMGFGLLFMLLFWGTLIVLSVWMVRGLFPSVYQPPAASGDRQLSAREILDRRFARGEISREEYDLMRETIAP